MIFAGSRPSKKKKNTPIKHGPNDVVSFPTKTHGFVEWGCEMYERGMGLFVGSQAIIFETTSYFSHPSYLNFHGIISTLFNQAQVYYIQ